MSLRRSARIASVKTLPTCITCKCYSKPLETLCDKCDIRVCSELCSVGYQTSCPICERVKMCKSCGETYCPTCSKLRKLTFWAVCINNKHNEHISTKYFTNKKEAMDYYFSNCYNLEYYAQSIKLIDNPSDYFIRTIYFSGLRGTLLFQN